jgi:hypothetical protein
MLDRQVRIDPNAHTSLVVKTKRKSPEHPPQFQGVFRLAEGSKRLIQKSPNNATSERLTANEVLARLKHAFRDVREIAYGLHGAMRAWFSLSKVVTDLVAGRS